MNVIVCDTPEEAGARAAVLVAAILRQRPNPVLGVATGESPLRMYAALRELVRDSVDVSHLRVFALDEYLGLDPARPDSFHSVVHREITLPFGLHEAAVSVPNGIGTEKRVMADAAEYETAIAAAGGVDVQVVGIGVNGHIGFNEPGSPKDSRTRIVMLAPETLAANARFFTPEPVPPRAVSQGIGTILEARNIVLLANGLRKAEAVRAAVQGRETVDVPASLLQGHPSLQVFLDRDAASLLS
ncbi:MAG: glucosamine-6-phosphate deaminase [Salinibacterium sp.]|nr:MAG: glucosamine-6-phosphate deaminase [Salinibacterium sp.]